jgi:hypothetical protein
MSTDQTDAPAPLPDTWYYTDKNDARLGPFMFAQLVAKAHARQISPDTKIWPPGHDDSRAARDVEDLLLPPYLGLSQRCKIYVVQHWRGELSIAKTFWINWVLLGFVIRLVSDIQDHLVQSTSKGSFSTYPGLLFNLGLSFSLAAVSIWQLVGMWRAATRHWSAGQGLWSGLPRKLCILGAMSASLAITTLIASTIVDVALIARDDRNLGACNVDIAECGQVPVYSGPISCESAARLSKWIQNQTRRANADFGWTDVSCLIGTGATG